MRIPVYQSQVGIQNANGGRSADYQNPHAFVSGKDSRLPHDLDQLAKGMGALGGAMHKIGIEERAQKLALDVTSDIQDILAQDSEIRAELQEQYRGADAAQSVEEYGKRTEQLLNGLTTKYQNNPQAVRQIQERLGSTFLAGTNAMRRYKDEQYTAYQGGVLDKQLSILQEVHSNPDSSSEQRQQAADDYTALRKQQLHKAGWDDGSIQRQLDDDIKLIGAKATMQELDYLEKTNPIEGLKVIDDALAGKSDTPRGIRNNNPGNIVKTSSSWDGEVEGKDERFKTFATPEHGIKAVGVNLLSYGKKGINTVSGIVKRWAPPHENNTQAYITQVSRVMNVAPDQPLDLKNPETLTRLTEAIIAHENGGIPYSVSQVERGVHAALEIAPLPEPTGDKTEQLQHEDFLPTKVAKLKTFLTPQQMAEKRASMAVAAGKQEQQNYIQQYSSLPPAEAVLAVASDPELIARPELQKKILNHFDLMAAAEERIAKAQESALKGQLVGAIEEVDLDAPDSSRQFEQIIAEAPYAMQGELTKIAKARVEGEDKITDPIAYDEAERRILAGERFDIRGDYAGKLNLVSQRRLVKMQDNEEFKEFVIKEKSLFDEEFATYMEDNPDSAYSRAELYRKFESTIPQGGFKHQDAREVAYAKFWQKVALKKPGWLWDSSEELRGFELGSKTPEGYYPKPGTPLYNELKKHALEAAREKNGPDAKVTEEEVARLFHKWLENQQGVASL